MIITGCKRWLPVCMRHTMYVYVKYRLASDSPIARQRLPSMHQARGKQLLYNRDATTTAQS